MKVQPKDMINIQAILNGAKLVKHPGGSKSEMLRWAQNDHH